MGNLLEGRSRIMFHGVVLKATLLHPTLAVAIAFPGSKNATLIHLCNKPWL